MTPNTNKIKYEPHHDKTNKMSVHPAKTQISLGIRPVWSESSLCAQWVAKDPRFLHTDSEDYQTERMPRLISVSAGRTLSLLVLSCRGSYKSWNNLIYWYLNVLREICLINTTNQEVINQKQNNTKLESKINF